jgi:hypothetical protein
MAIPRRRLALGGAALVMLLAVGVGLVQASSVGAGLVPATTNVGSAPPAAGNVAAALPVAATDRTDALLAALPIRGRGRIVHGTVTIDSPKDGLITVQIDGGTIAAVDAHSITIAEKGGGSVTVAIDSNTRVRRDRKRANAADLKVRDTVRVVSRIADGGAATARVIAVAAVPGG